LGMNILSSNGRRWCEVLKKRRNLRKALDFLICSEVNKIINVQKTQLTFYRRGFTSHTSLLRNDWVSNSVRSLVPHRPPNLLFHHRWYQAVAFANSLQQSHTLPNRTRSRQARSSLLSPQSFNSFIMGVLVLPTILLQRNL
jgi:hypothetical protein